MVSVRIYWPHYGYIIGVFTSMHNSQVVFMEHIQNTRDSKRMCVCKQVSIIRASQQQNMHSRKPRESQMGQLKS